MNFLAQGHSAFSFVCLIDSLHPSQESFSYVGVGLPVLDQC